MGKKKKATGSTDVVKANSRATKAEQEAAAAVAFLDAIAPSSDILELADTPAGAQHLLMRGRVAHEATEFVAAGAGGAVFSRLGPWGRLVFAGGALLGGVLQIACPEQNGLFARACDVLSGAGKGGNGVFAAEVTGGAQTKGQLKTRGDERQTTLDG